MEQLRIKLLQDAGLTAEVKLQVPAKPHMTVLQSRYKLKLLIKKGIDIMQQEAQEAQRLRQEELDCELALAAATGVECPSYASLLTTAPPRLGQGHNPRNSPGLRTPSPGPSRSSSPGPPRSSFPGPPRSSSPSHMRRSPLIR
eukprot:gene29057-32260_t